MGQTRFRLVIPCEGRLPAHLPRIERVIEPESTLCPCGCGEMAKVGEDRTERLDIVPARLRVLVTIWPKYICRACNGKQSAQAPAPDHLVSRGLPSEALPGAPIAPLPLAFGRRRYRTGFIARRSAEDHAPFRQLQETVRQTALERSRPRAR